MKKIHFIYRIDIKNAGDNNCCPFPYFKDYFSNFFCLFHDIEYIDWNTINRDDCIILGGGGILNVTNSFNININKCLERCNNVIGWGVGFNTHNSNWKVENEYTPIEFNKFSLIKIRDFNHPSEIEYCPCVSCLAPEFEYAKKNKSGNKEKRILGIVEHKDLKLPEFSFDYSFDKIYNSDSMDNIIKFIIESRIILTNSYHIVYWAKLLDKPVVVLNAFSDKFRFYKNKPDLYLQFKDSTNITRLFSKLLQKKVQNNFLFLNESQNKNLSYFEEIKTYIDNLSFNKSINDASYYYFKKFSSWNFNNRVYRISSDFYNQTNSSIMDFKGEITTLFSNIDRCKSENEISKLEVQQLKNNIDYLNSDLQNAIRLIDSNKKSLKKGFNKLLLVNNIIYIFFILIFILYN